VVGAASRSQQALLRVSDASSSLNVTFNFGAAQINPNGIL
jgi:hypothetical protein